MSLAPRAPAEARRVPSEYNESTAHAGWGRACSRAAPTG
jgi:hypothetical protein